MNPIKKIYNLSPRPIQSLMSFAYHSLFINPRYFFKSFRYFLRLKLDFFRLIGIKYKKLIRVKKFLFLPEGYDLICESFNDQLYKPLFGCNKILGLGAYVGDADIFLAQGCKIIHTFEPEKYKFEIMQKNILLNNLSSKIFPHNYAVANSNKKSLLIKKESQMDVSSSVTEYNDYKSKIEEEVPCMSIDNALKLDKFDGLKCDIEGAEWGIIEYFLNSKNWDFNKAIFELHFSKKNYVGEEKILKNFLNFLKSKNYKFSFYHNLKQIKKKKKFASFKIKEKFQKRNYAAIMLYIKK